MTTPQTFIAGDGVAGCEDLRRFFGKTIRDPRAVTYRPVIAVFAMTKPPDPGPHPPGQRRQPAWGCAGSGLRPAPSHPHAGQRCCASG